MATKLATLKANNEVKRQAVKTAKAEAQALQKQRLADERAVVRLQQAADRAKEHALMAQEHAADKAWAAEQRKAGLTLAKRQTAVKKAMERENLARPSGSGGSRMDKLEEQQRLLEEKAIRRGQAAEDNRLDQAEKQAGRDARRVRADNERYREEAEQMDAKQRRLEAIRDKKELAEGNRIRRAKEHLATSMRQGQTTLMISKVRVQLQNGQAVGARNSHDQSSSMS
ncbi:hypothetical protein PGT21_012322 [Puccinia graminis f. sp. tritici]|uniref:ATP-dependent DNA helicase sgs1 n=1 Tax=Puccinia graminis f. sp. tritici TaxID=56615 RepID=A0A5B0PNP0_PUCGR|nr:hypothetical protein PGT21_012322 [Puccinia graminis f. sp. tritici]